MNASNDSRREFLKTAGLGSAALLVSPALFGQIGHPKRPNILFIMADDHACNAIGSYESRLAKYTRTSNIDRIATEGIRLDNCHCTNSICVPSRATIMTGQYSHVNGVYSLWHRLDRQAPAEGRLSDRPVWQVASAFRARRF